MEHRVNATLVNYGTTGADTSSSNKSDETGSSLVLSTQFVQMFGRSSDSGKGCTRYCKEQVMQANDRNVDVVLANVLTVANCLKKIGNTVKMLFEFVGPKHTIHHYIKMIVRNLKDFCENTMGELSSTAQCAGNVKLSQSLG